MLHVRHFGTFIWRSPPKHNVEFWSKPSILCRNMKINRANQEKGHFAHFAQLDLHGIVTRQSTRRKFIFEVTFRFNSSRSFLNSLMTAKTKSQVKPTQESRNLNYSKKITEKWNKSKYDPTLIATYPSLPWKAQHLPGTFPGCGENRDIDSTLKRSLVITKYDERQITTK